MLPSSPSSSAILCLPFPTSVPNKVDGVQDVETLRSRMWSSDMIYCEGGTGAAILNHILIPNQKCYFSLIFISIIRSFIRFFFVFIIFLFIPLLSPVWPHKFSLCALSLPDFLLGWKLTSLLRPLLWIGAWLIWGIDAEFSSRRANTLQRWLFFKDLVCFCSSERRNDHSAGTKWGEIGTILWPD